MKETTFHPAPTWLTKQYLETILGNYKKVEQLQITSLTITPATAKGENYASVMTRVKAEFLMANDERTHHGSYIVKTSYENNPFAASIMSKYDIYNTEMLMYEKILPKLTELLQEIGDEDKLFADTIFVDYEHKAIIFEDLAASNFVIADRLLGMDEKHTKLTLKKLAKMHATAAVLNERLPNVLTELRLGIFNRTTRGFAPFFEGVFEVCANFAGECDALGPYYKDKLLKLKPYVMEYGTRCYDLTDGHFHTLTHGDIWTNNVMLRYGCDGAQQNGQQTKSIKDILLIDFQFSNWSSPTVDLHYFFNTSLRRELQLQHQDRLTQYYHHVLADTLHQLNFSGHIPSLHEFSVQMEHSRFYAVTSTLVTQSVMINDKNDDADFNSLMGTDERARNFRKILYTNKNIQENVKALLPYYDQKGLLDVTD